MKKLISTKDLSQTLNLSECHDGWWLYDATRGMNLAVRAKTPEEAFVQALKYYQGRSAEVEAQLAGLRKAVAGFTDELMSLDPDLLPE